VLEATPSPTSRVGTPPVTTTPDVIVASSSAAMPSPAGSDTPSSADTGPTAAKRLRLRSIKSELFIVNSELSRDTTDTDGSCDAPTQSVSGGVGRTVTSVVTAASDDSVDSSSVADMSQNSVAAGSADTMCQTSTDVVADDHLSSTDVQSAAVQVRSLDTHFISIICNI